MEVIRTSLFFLLLACAPLGYGAEVILANGDRYIGEVVDGVLSGKGTYIWAVGDRYEGNFANDQPDGLGTYTWIDGRVYEGQFVNGLRQGQGQLRWANGDFYPVSYTHLTLPTKRIV